jgi:hypothetical protein
MRVRLGYLSYLSFFFGEKETSGTKTFVVQNAVLFECMVVVVGGGVTFRIFFCEAPKNLRTTRERDRAALNLAVYGGVI